MDFPWRKSTFEGGGGLKQNYENCSLIFNQGKEHVTDPTDEYFIDLDIDILQGNDKKKSMFHENRSC